MIKWLLFALKGLRYIVSNGKIIHEMQEEISKIGKNQVVSKGFIEIQSFNTSDEKFGLEIKSLAMKPEFQFLMFSLRDSVVDELATIDLSNINKVVELKGQLKMMDIIKNYLEKRMNEVKT